jgi:hypothetical protein
MAGISGGREIPSACPSEAMGIRWTTDDLIADGFR